MTERITLEKNKKMNPNYFSSSHSIEKNQSFDGKTYILKCFYSKRALLVQSGQKDMVGYQASDYLDQKVTLFYDFYGNMHRRVLSFCDSNTKKDSNFLIRWEHRRYTVSFSRKFLDKNSFMTKRQPFCLILQQVTGVMMG